MTLSKRIAQVEAELAAQRAKVDAELARLRGLEAELASLRAAVDDQGELANLNRTDAILTVLRRAKATMSPSQVLEALNAGGRDDSLRDVTATLDHLLKKARVQRPDRGQYLAA